MSQSKSEDCEVVLAILLFWSDLNVVKISHDRMSKVLSGVRHEADNFPGNFSHLSYIRVTVEILIKKKRFFIESRSFNYE